METKNLALLFVLWATVYKSQAFLLYPQCGIGSTRAFRVVQGKYPSSDVAQCQYPWVAYILSQQLKCSGVIVGPRHVLTAAHCIQPENRPTLPAATEFQVFTGNANRKKGVKRTVAKVVVHDQYDRKLRTHDIGMLVLKNTIKYDRCHRPVCLYPTARQPPKQTYCKMVGWGATKLGGPMVDQLRMASATVAQKELCTDQYPSLNNETTFCAEQYYGNTACTGDDGGPFQCEENGKFYLHGIMSQIRENWCGIYMPFYTNVNYYISWVKKNE